MLDSLLEQSYTLFPDELFPQKKAETVFPIGFADLCCALVNQIAIDSSVAFFIRPSRAYHALNGVLDALCEA